MNQSLDVDEQVALEDIFAFLILLGRLLCDLVFPTEGGAALAAVDISDGMLASGHGPIAGLTFHYIYNFVKEISSSMLPIEGSRHHRG